MLSETHHKCGIGDCGKSLKVPINGKVAVEGETLVFTRADGSKVTFKRYQANK
jgi:aerobic-type carbon monoxide dehydrogenase small subunit (CoxS/CutS family)